MSPLQCVAARALLGWTQVELARVAGVGVATIADFERVRRKTHPLILAALKASLEGAGVEFLRGPKFSGVLLRES